MFNINIIYLKNIKRNVNDKIFKSKKSKNQMCDFELREAENETISIFPSSAG